MVDRDLTTDTVGWVAVLIHEDRDEALTNALLGSSGQDSPVSQADILAILIESWPNIAD